ncbi:prmC [Symbiodinium sp. CCMP2592]|nr:prmC [Symbiodinium sp. CCMP2592]
MTAGIALPLRVRPGAPTPRRRGGWRLCLLAAAPRALATVAIKQPGTPVRLPVSSEDSPQVIASNGDLLVAWKPPKLSMRRRRGGEASDLEAWAAAAAGAATAVTTLGRGIGGLVLLSRRRESAKEAAAAIKGGQAKASLHAVVQGEPVLEDAGIFDEGGEPLGGPESRLEVLRACEGLKLGRLSLLKVTLQYEEGIEKQVRRVLAQLEHRVIGNGQLCARAAGLRRTFLAVTGFRFADLDVQLPPPASFERLLDADSTALQRRGGAATWSGRTEHCSEEATFDGLTLRVPPGVFVPRRSALPIVEAAADVSSGAFRVLDCGTGSGCILLALLSRFGAATGVGIDADEKAVKAAAHNAKALSLSARCDVQHRKFVDIALMPDEGIAPFDIAVSNPPYLPAKLMKHVGFAREISSQSTAAFAAGEDGLRAYEELAVALSKDGVLKDSAHVVMGCQPGKASWAAGPFLQMACYEVLALHRECAVLRFSRAT